MPNAPIQFTLQTGAPIHIGSTTITVRSRVLRILLPRVSGGLVWNRPVSLRVQNADGTEQELPVRDVTRLAQWTLMGLGVLCLLIAVRKR